MENELSKEFVTYEQALALKELVFDEYCVGYFIKPNIIWYEEINQSNLIDGEVLAPLKQQVFRWFREKYELYYRISGVKQSQYHYSIDHQYKDGKWEMMGGYITTYEEAENACIDKLLEIAKQQDK